MTTNDRRIFDLKVSNLQGTESVHIAVGAANPLEALANAAAPRETSWQVQVFDSTDEHLTQDLKVRATSVQTALTAAAAMLANRGDLS